MAGDAAIHDLTAAENWARYEYVRDRGHREYCAVARLNEDFYLGAPGGGVVVGGGQWSDIDRQALASARRPAYEFNEIMPGVNSAIGYQIANRVDIAYRPRGGQADDKTAQVLSKLAMHIADSCKLHHKETTIFSDGLIQQRGYYDLRINFDDQMRGEVEISTLDPMDVLPDPDAKSYDPNDWQDVIVTRWMTADEIERRYGKPARSKAEAVSNPGDSDFGDQEIDGETRNTFSFDSGNTDNIHDASWNLGGTIKRLRVVDRQVWEFGLTRVAVFPDTGDVRVVEKMPPEKLAILQAKGAIITKRMQKRVRWIVSTADTTIHDDYSPFDFFTVIPYFAYFRRGRTRGMVDPAIGPQMALNKTFSQYVHIINTVANSGWMSEEDSLANMDDEDLRSEGATTGVHIVVKKNARFPEKIKPNQVPEGVDRFIDRTTQVLKEVTTPDEMRGIGGKDQSGKAIQSKQFASQQQLAVPLDNLGLTRNMLAERLLWCIQHYYDDERVFRITETDPKTGQESNIELRINQFDPASGSFINDLTVGEYDVVISEAPMQVTFENGQFEQAMSMKKEGVPIPDDVIIRHSTLADKTEILSRMASQPEKVDPTIQAKADLLNAQAEKTRAEMVNKSVEAQFSAIQTAQTIATIPQTAPLADALLRSAGYQDKDAAPIVPELPAALPGVAPPPENTNPLTPRNPATGMNAGIEGGQSVPA